MMPVCLPACLPALGDQLEAHARLDASIQLVYGPGGSHAISISIPE
jgi:hypothetical protein